jgi:hypothetical protein
MPFCFLVEICRNVAKCVWDSPCKDFSQDNLSLMSTMAAMSPLPARQNSHMSPRFYGLKTANSGHHRFPCLEGGEVAHIQHGVGMARGNDLGFGAILAQKRARHLVYGHFLGE